MLSELFIGFRTKSMGDDVLRNLLSLEFLLEVVLDHMQKIDSSARELELR